MLSSKVTPRGVFPAGWAARLLSFPSPRAMTLRGLRSPLKSGGEGRMPGERGEFCTLVLAPRLLLLSDSSSRRRISHSCGEASAAPPCGVPSLRTTSQPPMSCPGPVLPPSWNAALRKMGVVVGGSFLGAAHGGGHGGQMRTRAKGAGGVPARVWPDEDLLGRLPELPDLRLERRALDRVRHLLQVHRTCLFFPSSTGRPWGGEMFPAAHPLFPRVPSSLSPRAKPSSSA